MLKLKKLIKEHTWDREFGDPLPTFEDVMEKHQVNKLNEDWWDNMSPEDQAEYIKAHPTSQKAQASKEEPKEKPSDRYADVDTSWMDDPEAAAAQGSPGYTTDDNWGREKGYGQPGHKSYEYIPKSKDDSEGDFPKDPDDIDDLPDDEPDYSPGHPDTMGDDELKQFLDKDAEDDDGEPYKRASFQAGDDPEELSLGAAQDELKKAKAEMAHAEEMGDKNAYADAEEKEYALQGRIGRTGKELNQETLMIDGKQYNRISEGVEKQPKPKYEFSEFYQRFKRQE